MSDKRKDKILDLLLTNGEVKVLELSKLFNVSEVTIRSYLADMEKKGLLSRIHGGAICSYKPYYSMNMNQRLEANHSEKVYIADKIAQMVKPNDTIMLNSGTTTLITFRKFPVDYNLNIVTNSISIALEASSNPNYNVVLIGGAVNTKYQFTFGSDALSQLSKYHADKLVLSVDGIDIDNGFTSYYNNEADIDKLMIEKSDMCIIAADYSKFNRVAFTKISNLSVADCIVTNSPIDDKILKKFEKLDINVVI